MADFTTTFNEISDLLQKGKAKEIVVAVENALKDGAAPADILQKGLLTGMSVIGGKFKNGEVFVPEGLIAARAMNRASAALKPAPRKWKYFNKYKCNQNPFFPLLHSNSFRSVWGKNKAPV